MIKTLLPKIQEHADTITSNRKLASDHSAFMENLRRITHSSFYATLQLGLNKFLIGQYDDASFSQLYAWLKDMQASFKNIPGTVTTLYPKEINEIMTLVATLQTKVKQIRVVIEMPASKKRPPPNAVAVHGNLSMVEMLHPEQISVPKKKIIMRQYESNTLVENIRNQLNSRKRELELELERNCCSWFICWFSCKSLKIEALKNLDAELQKHYHKEATFLLGFLQQARKAHPILDAGFFSKRTYTLLNGIEQTLVAATSAKGKIVRVN